MSDLNKNNDYNEIIMKIFVYGFVIIMIFFILLFVLIAIFNGPQSDKNKNDPHIDNKSTIDIDNENTLHIDDKNKNSLQIDDMKSMILENNSVIKTVIKSEQGGLFDVVLNRQKVPIDYWLFSSR